MGMDFSGKWKYTKHYNFLPPITGQELQSSFLFLYFYDYRTFLAGSHFFSNQELSRGLSVHKELPLKSLIASSISSTFGALAIRLIRKSTSSRLPRTPFEALLVHSHQAFSRWKSQRTTSESAEQIIVSN